MSNFGSRFAFLAKSKAEDEDDDKTPKDKRDDDEAEKARKAKRKAKDEEADDDDEDDDEDEDEDGEGTKKDKDDKKDSKASAARARERSRIRAIFLSKPGMANPAVAAHIALDTDMPRASAIAALGAVNMAARIPDFATTEGKRERDVSKAMAAAIIAAGEKARGESLGGRPGLRERMGGIRNPDVGSDGGRSDGGGPSMADRIIAAGKKARGEA